MQLVPVDEPAGRQVPNLGVVLPAVPQLGRHIGDFACFAPQFVGGCRVPAAEETGLALGGRHVDPPAGPAAADPVEGGDGGLDVEGLGVRGRDGGHQADAVGGGRDAGQDGERVGPRAGEGVAERHEVESAALGEPRRLDVGADVVRRLLVDGGGQVQEPPAVR